MVIQSHLKKLFAGIHTVQFDEEDSQITAMRSLEGELVPLARTVPISADVEVWLGKLADEMQHTLQELLVECVRDGRGGGGGGVDPRSYPSQVLCLSEEVLFTERCEQAMGSGTLAELLIELEAQLDSYTRADVSVSHCVCG